MLACSFCESELPAQMLALPSIAMLHKSSCALGDHGLQMLVPALHQLMHLRELTPARNILHDVAAPLVAQPARSLWSLLVHDSPEKQLGRSILGLLQEMLLARVRLSVNIGATRNKRCHLDSMYT
jgi:hypothetical protein